MLRLLSTVTFASILGGCNTSPTVGDTGAPKPTSDVIITHPTAGATRTSAPQHLDPIEVVGQTPIFDANFPDAQFSYEAPDRPDACASVEFAAERLPLDVYIMLDRSGSMNIPQSFPPDIGGDCDVGDTLTSRWCRTLGALDGFFTSGAREGTGVALQFFPNGMCSDTPPIGHNCCESGACCGGAADAIPSVELADLATNHQALVDALNAQSPAGVTTPVEAALRGLTTWTGLHATSGRNMAGLLITDGEPTGCNQDATWLGTIVADHFAATRIPTFVIGMEGAKFAPLEEIAKAGGVASHTDHCPAGISPCHVYSVGAANSAVFTDALEQIKGSVALCNYAVPHPEAGVIDPAKLSVVFTSGNGPVALTLTSGADACADGGFFMNGDGSALTLCPSSCESVRAADISEVRIAVQCLGI
jgi:hypothetical protein